LADGTNNRTGVFIDVNGEEREVVIELLDDKLVEIYRTWTPARSLKAAADLTRDMRRLLKNQLASLHPDWSPEEVDREVARRFLGDAL
jgi:hypothetical protein